MDDIDEGSEQRMELFCRVAPALAEYSIDVALDVLLLILADIGVQVGTSKEEFLAEMNEQLEDLFTQVMEKNNGNSTHH